jgi:O-antigen/teichoic acid export membrane protein
VIGTLFSQARNRRIIFASGAGIAQRAIQIGTSLVTLPLVLHSLGIVGFGIWGAAMSLAVLSSMLDFGLGSALVTLIPRGIASGETERIRGLVTAAFFSGSTLTTLFLVCGGLLVLSGTIRMPHPAFLIADIAILLNIPLSIANDMWFSLQKGYIAAWWQTVQNVLTSVLLIIGAFARADVTFMVAVAYAVLLLTNSASLVHIWLKHPGLRPVRNVSIHDLRAVLTQGGQMFFITIVASLAYALDNLMALNWLGPVASAQMTIALRVCTTATGMLGVATLPFWPGFADAIAADDRPWLRRALRNGTFAVAGISITGSGLLIAFGGPVLRWWLREDLHITQVMLWVMAAWIVMTTLPHMPGLFLHAALRLRPQIFVLSATAIVSFVLKYFAAKSFGVAGILSVSPLLWMFLVSPAYFWLAWCWIAKTEREAAAKTLGS